LARLYFSCLGLTAARWLQFRSPSCYASSPLMPAFQAMCEGSISLPELSAAEIPQQK
jgi:hypothetical protein